MTIIIKLSDLASRDDIANRTKACDAAILEYAEKVAPGCALGEIYHPLYSIGDYAVEYPDVAEVPVLIDGLAKNQWLRIERLEKEDEDGEVAGYEVALILWTSDNGEGEENAGSSTGIHYDSIAEVRAALGL